MGANKPFLAISFLIGASALVSACSTGGSSTPTTAVVRNTAETAPADLQLTCASEAAIRFNVSSDKVLPTSSGRADAGSYQVDLTLDGEGAVCLVSENGVVLSLNKV